MDANPSADRNGSVKNTDEEELRTTLEAANERARRAEQALQVSNERLRILEEGLHEYAVIWVDPCGVITHWSAGASRLFGYRAEEIIGQPASRLLGKSDPPRGEFEKEMQTAIRQGRSSDIGWHLRKEGSRFWGNGSTTAIKDATGTVQGFVKIVRDLTELREVEQTLRDSEHTLRMALNAARMGLWRWNIQTNQETLDENLYRLLGRPTSQPISSLEDFYHFVHPDDRHIVEEAFDRSVREASEINIEFRVIWPDGSIHWLRDQGGLCRDAQDRPLYLTGACVDITQRKELETTAKRRAEELAVEDRRKDEFLAMLGHELRNPLAPIRSAVQVLRSSDQDEARRHWAHNVIDRQVRHLTRLVDDLLDVSRITRGKIQLHPEPVDLATVLTRAAETTRPLIEARRHQLHIELPAGSVWLEADPIRLAQVVANLLNNAAKYTEEGGHIWLTAAAEAGLAIIRVKDSGIGISPEMLSRVFDMFAQADCSLDRSQGGLGIGLTLVRSLVELHRGTVEAHSAGPNRGSEFVVRLPLRDIAGGPRDAGPRGVEPSSVRPPARRVLVVDDNTDAADGLAMVLRGGGHEVRTAYDGPSALVAAQEFHPEIALVDIGLPGMTGYEVAQRLRERPDTARATLVALTGYGQEEDRRHSQEAGFDYHLVKPVEPRALEHLLLHPAAGR